MLAGRATTAVLRRSLARSAGTASAGTGMVVPVSVAGTSALQSSTISSTSAIPASPSRSFSTAIEESLSARDAWQKSCYVQIDYTINEDLTVYDAIQRFAAYDIGCLVTVDSAGAFVIFCLRCSSAVMFGGSSVACDECVTSTMLYRSNDRRNYSSIFCIILTFELIHYKSS